MYDRAKLIEELERDEGVRDRPYMDTAGKITIGVGRNLTDVPLSQPEIEYLLENDIARAEVDLTMSLPWWRDLDDVRQRVMINLCFNMGIGNLLGFKSFLADMQHKYWKDAAQGLKNSLYYRQVGARAERLAHAVETGEMPR